MKKYTLVALVALVSFSYTSVFSQDTWIKQKLDEKIYVKFPTAPESLGNNTYKVQGLDSIAYTANTVDFEAFGLDSATLASMSESDEFVNQFKTGFVAQMPGVEIKKLDINKWNENICYDIEGELASKQLKIFIKCIFIGSKMYTFFSAVPPTGILKNKDTFFSSINFN